MGRARTDPRYNGLGHLWLRRADHWIEWPSRPLSAPVSAVFAGQGYAPIVLAKPHWPSIPSDYPAGWAVTTDGEMFVWPLSDPGAETSRWYQDAVEIYCSRLHPARYPSAHRRLAAIEAAILERLPRLIPVPSGAALSAFRVASRTHSNAPSARD